MSEHVNVFYNSQEYTGWQSVSINNSIDMVCASFALKTAIDWPSFNDRYRMTPGGEVQIFMASNFVLDGFIDSINMSVSNSSHSISLSGRSGSSLIVDSMVETLGERKYTTWKGLVEAIGVRKNTGVNVDIDFDDEKFAERTVVVEAGETYFDVLSRKAKKDGVLLTSNSDGLLIIKRDSGFDEDASLDENSNVLSASMSVDNISRYSKYIIYSQDPNGDNDTETGTAADEGISIKKTFIDVESNAATSSELKVRAEWEANTREAKSQRITCSVVGTTYKSGGRRILWRPNIVVPVFIPSLFAEGNFLITSCTYKYSEKGGSITEISLEREGARTIDPTKKSEVISSGWADS